MSVWSVGSVAVHVTQRSAVPCLCWGERGGEWNAGAILGHWLGCWRACKPGLHLQYIVSFRSLYTIPMQMLGQKRLGYFVKCRGIPWHDPKSRPRLLAWTQQHWAVCLGEQGINILCFVTMALCLPKGQRWSKQRIAPLKCIISWQINISILLALFCVIAKTLGLICMIICWHLKQHDDPKR